jgi:hypothetical protein
MNWADAFAILFAFVGLGIWFHGFPDITIGGNHWHTTNYNNEEQGEEK